jgi:hypothetical protein
LIDGADYTRIGLIYKQELLKSLLALCSALLYSLRGVVGRAVIENNKLDARIALIKQGVNALVYKVLMVICRHYYTD